MLIRTPATIAHDDQPDLKGLRDYALLILWLHTGRDRLEIAALRRQHLQIQGNEVTIFWRGRATNGTRLSSQVSEAVLRYLHALHGPALDLIEPDTPVWVRLRGNRGEMLGIEMIDAVYRQYRRSQSRAAAQRTEESASVFGD